MNCGEYIYQDMVDAQFFPNARLMFLVPDIVTE